jgi:hypothetical protein
MLDPASLLEKFLYKIDANIITNIFIFAILSLFLFSLLLSIIGKGKIFTSYTSGILTSLGILGTFIGIVIGLLEFNPKHIDESIELLLNGLKTAFITSLVGMFAAIFYKILESTPLFKINRIISTSKSVSSKDILNAMLEQNSSFEDLKKHLLISNKKEDKNKLSEKQIILMAHQNKNLIGLKNAISGTNEDSLSDQIKLLREDIKENNKNQHEYFLEFSENLWVKLKRLVAT